MRVELKAAFTGVTWLPSWVALSHSSIAPHLILDEEGIDYKVVIGRRRRYDEIASVDFRKTFGTRNIIIRFKTGSATFTGNAASDEEARNGLAALRNRGCFLSSRAIAFLA